MMSLKSYGADSISFDELKNFNTDCIANHKEIQELLIFVFNKYGFMSGSALINKTHSEEPWLKTYDKTLGNEISQELILKFFKKEIKKEP